MEKQRILVVEDDRTLREGLAMNLRMKGYEVITAADGEEGLQRAFADKPDLLVLDIMLPVYSGLELLSEMRERGNNTPVLILSARGRTDQKVQGLGLGADDYLAKPFELAELLARIQVLLRRSGKAQSAPPMSFGNVVVDTTRRTVQVAGADVSLSAKEFDVLLLLAKSPGRVYSRDQILEQVWGWDFEGTPRTVDNHIVSLRKALNEDPRNPSHIITVRQVGYRLDP